MKRKVQTGKELKAFLYKAGEEYYCTCPSPKCNHFIRNLTAGMEQVACIRCGEIFKVEYRI